MIEYSQEELSSLERMLIEAHQEDSKKAIYNSLENLIGRTTNSKDTINSLIINPMLKELENINNVLNKTAPWHIDRIKNMPIEDMPLLVNDKDVSSRTAAIWRLKMGK
jgi:hypothetical protein